MRILFLCFLIALSNSLLAQSDTATYFSSFDKVKIHYTAIGHGRPVLLLHGFTGTGSDWKGKPVTDSLLAKGFQVIMPDLRGNGLSGKPVHADSYAHDAEAKDLIGLITFLGIKNYAAVGYSRGSIILARLLVKDKRCTRAVIGGMGADFTNPRWPRRLGFYNALMNDSIRGYDEFRKYIASKGLNPRDLAYQQKEQPSTSPKELAGIKAPVLIICGNADQDNGKGNDLQKLIPGSKFVEVTGNHNTSAWTSEFAGKVAAFLK